MSAKSPKLIIGVSLLALFGVVIIFGIIYFFFQVTKKTWLNPKLTASYHSNAIQELKRTNWDGAIENLNAAIAVNPHDAWAYVTRGHAYGMKGNHRLAMKDFSKTIELNASDPWPYAYRGYDYSLQHELDHALADYNRAVLLSSNGRSEAYMVTLEYRSTLYAHQKEWSKTLADLNQLFQFKPNDSRLYGNRAYVLSRLGKYAEAITNLTIELKLNPTNAKAYTTLASCQFRREDYSKAIQAYLSGLNAIPDNPLILNDYAWFLSTCPEAEYRNGSEAVAKATKSCELYNWKSWYTVSTLAAAYAETGDFDNAVKYQKQTIAMDGLTDKERAEANAHLKLYEAHKPYRESPEKPMD